jgi:hypothetical protein
MNSFEPLNIAAPREKERKVPAPLIIFGEVLFSYRVGVQETRICNVEPLLILKLQVTQQSKRHVGCRKPRKFCFLSLKKVFI